MASSTKAERLTELLRDYVKEEEKKKQFPQKYLSDSQIHYVQQCPLGSEPCEEGKEVCPPKFMGTPFQNEMRQQCFGKEVLRQYRASQAPTVSKTISDVHRMMAGVAELKMKLSPLTIHVRSQEDPDLDEKGRLQEQCKRGQQTNKPNAKEEDRRALCEMMGTEETQQVLAPLGMSLCRFNKDECGIRPEFLTPFNLFTQSLPGSDDSHVQEVFRKLRNGYFQPSAQAVMDEFASNVGKASVRNLMQVKFKNKQLTDDWVANLKQVMHKILDDLREKYPEGSSKYPSNSTASEIIDLYVNYFASMRSFDAVSSSTPSSSSLSSEMESSEKESEQIGSGLGQIPEIGS